MLKRLKQLSSELVTENGYWQYRKDRYTYPNADEGEYHYVHTPGSVMVIPVTPEGKLVLVRQFRYLNQREGLEFVGGGVKQGLAPEAAAASELKEEAGLVATTLGKSLELCENETTVAAAPEP